MSDQACTTAAPLDLLRARIRQALDAGDASTALERVDALPEPERAGWLAEVWMLAGSPRAVEHLLPALREGSDPTLQSRAEAFVQRPPRRPIPTSGAPDPHAALIAQADRLAALGRAAELAMTHLALAEVSPRVDWRAVHVDHAASLALGLGDPALSALVRAYEAQRDASFGELEDALEAAHAAIEQGTQADEPRAVELGTRVAANVAPLVAQLERDRASELDDAER